MRALLVGEAVDPEGPDAPGLVVLSQEGEVESATPGVERWLAALPDGDWDAGRLPSAVLAVAGRALRTAEYPDQPGEVAVSRVLSRSGTWMVLHGASLVSGGAHRAAVIVEPAHPARIAPLLMSVYGLTEREQEVTRLVLQGNSTAEIAERLVVSAHTVQQHLKSVFDKTRVRSRRDLVGKVFFTHYEPRLRDNERRALADRPLRGGPLDSHATRAGRAGTDLLPATRRCLVTWDPLEPAAEADERPGGVGVPLGVVQHLLVAPAGGRCTRVASPSTHTASPEVTISASSARRSSRVATKLP
jgi:DNA-binding CsgD family transcriptional regulator